MRKITFDLSKSRDRAVRWHLGGLESGLWDPGTIEVANRSRLKRFDPCEIILVHLISPSGKTKLIATGFCTITGIRLDGQIFDKYEKRNGKWNKQDWKNRLLRP